MSRTGLGLRSTSELGPLRDAAFRALWVSQLVSVSGNFVSAIALPLVAIATLHASPFQLGLLAAMNTLPGFLFGLMAGAWVDRLPRRRVLIATNLGRGVLLAAVPFAWWHDVLSVELLLFVQFAVGFLFFLFDVTYLSYSPTLVARSQLLHANGLMEVSHSIGRISGPSLGGVLVQAFGAPLAILADCLSFVVATAWLATIRRPEPPRDRPAASARRVLAEIAEGIRFVASHRVIACIAVFNALFQVFHGAFSSLYVLYATETLGLRAAVLGLVVGVGSAGALAGALVARQLLSRGIGLTTLAACECANIVLAPLALLVPAPAGLLAIGQFTFSLCNTAYNVGQIALRQALTPDRLQGRVMASIRSAISGAQVAGSVLGGIAAQYLGVTTTLALLAPAVTALAAWYLVSPVRAASPPRP